MKPTIAHFIRAFWLWRAARHMEHVVHALSKADENGETVGICNIMIGAIGRRMIELQREVGFDAKRGAA